MSFFYGSRFDLLPGNENYGMSDAPRTNGHNVHAQANIRALLITLMAVTQLIEFN